MASSTETENDDSFFSSVKDFPPVVNGKINAVEFLQAASDLVSLVERLGKVFAPVKYDMQGNIDKINKHYVFDEESCLLELMLDEVNNRKGLAAEGILWLNRAFLFFELVFHEIIKSLQANNYELNMVKIFTVGYEGSVKAYHNWVTQQIFVLICKMSPTFPQILKSLEVTTDMKTFETRLANFNIKLHLIRCKLDDFFKDNQLFNQ